MIFMSSEWARSMVDRTMAAVSGKADVLAACNKNPPPAVAAAPEHNTLEVVFNRGTVYQYELDPGQPKQIGWQGTYRVYRDTLELSESDSVAVLTTTWSLHGSTLTLSNLRNGGCVDAAVWTRHPWIKVK
jgi:hypothetical protein